MSEFFTQYLHVVKPLLVPALSPRHMKVLGELMYYNYVYRDINLNKRGLLIFDYDNKMEIAEKLGISTESLSNTLSDLRRMKYINKNTLKKSLLFVPEKNFSLNYKFTIE